VLIIGVKEREIVGGNSMVSYFRVKEVICFGEGAGANILARFAVSI